VPNNTTIYLRRTYASFVDSPSLIKNVVHTHPNSSTNTVVAPSIKDLRLDARYANTYDETQIVYLPAIRAIIFFTPGQNGSSGTAIVDNHAYYFGTKANISAAAVISLQGFRKML
jgi:hypothetical protein